MRTKTRSTRRYPPLTDNQIQSLARTICCAGDQPVEKSGAMLVLMDEIMRHPQKAENIALTAKTQAVNYYVDNDPQLIDAQIELLRSEIDD